MKRALPILLILLLFAAYIFLEVSGPEPLQFDADYTHEDSGPFGSMLLYEMLDDIFPEQEIEVVRQSPKFEFDPGDMPRGTNMIIIEENFEPDRVETQALLDYVRAGNSLFLAARYFRHPFTDSLDNFVSYSEDWERYAYYFGMQSTVPDTPTIILDAIFGDTVSYKLLPGIEYSYFYDLQEDAVPLGYAQFGNVNFASIAIGEGNLYLHSVPFMFTNYHMVKWNSHTYISQALSVMPVGPVYWDEYFKPVRKGANYTIRYVLEDRALRWAWYIFLCTIVLFIFFQGKRRQRIVPVLHPPENATLKFTRTVGQLYLRTGNHKDIAFKKIRYLLDFIRNRYQMDTRKRNQQFLNKLASRSNIPLKDIERLFDTVERTLAMQSVTESHLMDLSRQIDTFYEKTK